MKNYYGTMELVFASGENITDDDFIAMKLVGIDNRGREVEIDVNDWQDIKVERVFNDYE